MTIRFHGITLYVRDLRRMIEFYRDVLGIPVKWTLGESSAAFQHQGIELTMREETLLTEYLGTIPNEPLHLHTHTILTIELPYFADVDREFNWIAKAGGQPIRAPLVESRGIRRALIADPEGNLLELYSTNQRLAAWEQFLATTTVANEL